MASCRASPLCSTFCRAPRRAVRPRTGGPDRVRRLLIAGGTLIDGTGAPARVSDLLIEDDRIVDLPAPGSIAAGRRTGPALDASGLVVCPGFIDIHSHGD